MSALYVVIILAVIFVSGSLGYFAGTTNPAKVGLQQNKGPGNTASNPIFNSQLAIVQGKITKLNNKTVTLENSANKQSGDFEVADSVFITKFNPNSPTATPSSDLKSIELNRDASINLQLINSQYKVVTISFFPAPPVQGTQKPANP